MRCLLDQGLPRSAAAILNDANEFLAIFTTIVSRVRKSL